jgi:4-carboxymuconolactone decarboxylase
MNKEPSAAEKLIGDFAPKLVDLTDRVLFGDVWEREPGPRTHLSESGTGCSS